MTEVIIFWAKLSCVSQIISRFFLNNRVRILNEIMGNNFNLNFCFSVSPEVLGFLTAIGLFIILMTLLFWYLNNKLALENPGSLQCLDDFRKKAELQGEPAFTYECFCSLFVLFCSRFKAHFTTFVSTKLEWFLIVYLLPPTNT